MSPAETPVTPLPVIPQNITPPPANDLRADDETEKRDAIPVKVVNDPLPTRVVGEEKPSVFEITTLRYARWGFLVAAVTFAVGVGTAVMFWEQFREMS